MQQYLHKCLKYSAISKRPKGLLTRKREDVKPKIMLWFLNSRSSETNFTNFRRIKIQFQILWLVPVLFYKATALRSPNRPI